MRYSGSAMHIWYINGGASRATCPRGARVGWRTDNGISPYKRYANITNTTTMRRQEGRKEGSRGDRRAPRARGIYGDICTGTMMTMT